MQPASYFFFLLPALQQINPGNLLQFKFNKCCTALKKKTRQSWKRLNKQTIKRRIGAAEDVVIWKVSSRWVSRARAADNITSSCYHIHAVFAASTGLYGRRHFFLVATYIPADTHRTHTRRHEQPRPCRDMTMANEAWQRASLHTSQPGLPVWLSGLHYPHDHANRAHSHVWKQNGRLPLLSPLPSL